MRRYFVTVILVLLVGVVVLYLLTPRSPVDWRHVSVSFGGWTNSLAVMSINNDGPVSIVLRDRFGLEFVGIAPRTPVTGLPNKINYTRTGTNLIVGPSESAEFLIPMPTEGQRWIAHLEFAPAGVKTKLGEFLIRRQDRVSKSLPTTIRSVPIYIVSQEFSR